MLLQNESRATKLREVLGGLNLQLEQSECVEVLSKIDHQLDWKADAAELSESRKIAEQYADEMIEGIFEASYAKFTRRFEQKYLVNFPESEFLKENRYLDEDVGAYIGREYLGCLSGRKEPGDDRYPNHVRYLWRCFLEKNEALVRVGIYQKDGIHYVCEAGTV